jgi:hypothetical protein
MISYKRIDNSVIVVNIDDNCNSKAEDIHFVENNS